MKNAKNHHHSLFQKIIIPLLAVILFQSVVFFCATFFGGISATLRQNAEDVLAKRVASQQSALNSKFTTQWTNLSVPQKAVNQIYAAVSAETGAPVRKSAEAQRTVLERAAEPLIAALRSNEVTGVFLILNDASAFAPLTDSAEQTKYGLCIRDYDPLSSYSKTEDLMVLRCPSALTHNIGCSLDTGWDALFTFDETHPGDYYYKPLQLAYENPGVDATDLAYFGAPHIFGRSDRQVVTYSIPLTDSSGYPYGVLGVELTVDYLKSLLPSSTIYSGSDSGYALVQYDEGTQDYRIIASSGVLFTQCFGNADSFSGQRAEDGILSCTGTQTGVDLRGSVCDLQIYNHNTPFESERLALVALVKSKSLYSLESQVRQRLLLVSVLVMGLGVLLVLVVSRQLTSPILRLSQKVRSAEGAAGVSLERLQIDEIDDLVDSIEELNDKINRSAIRTEFFSRMSHDMRTPMNAIIGFSSPEMLESVTMEQMCSYMEKIHSSGSYLLGLINEVLDMAKIETQRMELRLEPLNQKVLLAEVEPMIRELAEEKQVDFVVESSGADLAFYGDRQRLEQVLMNFLSNAVKFTPAGGRVLLRLSELAHSADQVTHQIVIQDTGIGMSAEFQKKMYEPFSQEKTGQGGTGLGLAIARQMIGLMNGTLKCESLPGAGTTFTVRLTSRRAAETELTPAAAALPAEAQNAFAGKNVLLCEDHPLNAQIARRLLERRGMTVREAHDGAEGVALFRASAVGEFDAVLMDIRMPNMNGLEATRALRALDRADAKTVPIIAMTANAFKEDVQESSAAGMNAHLSKPIDPQILYATLREYLCS